MFPFASQKSLSNRKERERKRETRADTPVVKKKKLSSMRGWINGWNFSLLTNEYLIIF